MISIKITLIIFLIITTNNASYAAMAIKFLISQVVKLITCI